MIRTTQKVLLFVCCFTLPLAAFSLFEIGTFGMSPFKLTTAILLGLALVGYTQRGQGPGGDAATKWVVFYAVAVTVSIAQGFLRGLPRELLIPETTTYYSIILFFVLIGFVVRDIGTLRAGLWGLVLGGAVTGAPAVLGLERASELGRYSGLAGQPNVLGENMAFVIPAAIGLLVSRRRGFGRLVLIGSIFVTTGAMLLSLSRTAYVSAAAMWGLWVQRSGRLDTIWYLVPGLAILIGVVLLAPSQVADRIETMTNPTVRKYDGSIQMRVDQVELSLKAFASNPVTGVGLLGFVPWAHEQREGRGVRWVVHSSYLSLLAEQGLLGFVPYVMILAVSWQQYSLTRKAARRRRRLGDSELAELGALALFLQLALFAGLIGGFASIMHKSKTLWLIVALGPVVYRLAAMRIQQLEASGVAEPAQPARWNEPLPAPAGARTTLSA